MYTDIPGLYYNDVTMSTMASPTTSLTILTQPFVQGQIEENIKAPRHWLEVNSAHKWPVTRQMFPFNVIMYYFLVQNAGH